MPQVGPLELLFVGILALIVFGPQKLPEIARTVGRAMTELRRMASEVRSEFEVGLDDVEDEPDDEPERPRPAAEEAVTEPPVASTPSGSPEGDENP
jgi:Tat protein translocase TatB subunit